MLAEGSFVTPLPDESPDAAADQVDTSAWLQADLNSPDTYFTDDAASVPEGTSLNNKLYLPVIQR